jgi:glycosyltransferase involved in cell wall biosynthesis
MRIARVLSRLNLGGPARQVEASDPLLVARGHGLRVFCGRPEEGEGDLAPQLERLGVDVVRVPGLARGPALFSDLSAAAFLARELRAFRPDVVHTHASKAGLLGRLVAPRGAALVHTFHGHVLEGYFGPRVSRALARLERALARRTDVVVAVSRATAQDLVRLEVCGAERIALSPPGVRLADVRAVEPLPASPDARARLGLPAAGFVVAFVGRLAPVKRPGFAGAVLAELVAAGVDAHLAVAGDGPGRAELLAGAASARERVHVLGAVPDVAPLFAAADAVLSCSRNEGLPVALIEAAAAARPVVAVDVGGIAELVADGRTGHLVPAGAAPGVVAAALLRLAADPATARALGLAARASAAPYEPSALVARLESIYERALGARRARRGEVARCAS